MTAYAVIGALLIWGGANAELRLPGTFVPQSLQTLAVIIVGALLRFPFALLAVCIYLGAGAAGLPVFSDGGSGLDHLFGPTGGYLFSFAIAAGFIAVVLQRFGHSMITLLLVAIAAHVIILGLGASWLAANNGVQAALQQGVLPFIVGALVKSALATILVALTRKTILRSWPNTD